MSASSSSRRARATSSAARAAELAEAARGRAKIVAVTVDADDAALDVLVEALKPDVLQLHGGETPERVGEVKARYGLPVMKAFAGPHGARISTASMPIAASPTGCSSTPSRRKVRSFPAATAWPSTGGLSPRLTARSITCFPVD